MHPVTALASLLLTLPAIAQKNTADPVVRHLASLEARLARIHDTSTRVAFLLARARDSGAAVTTAVEILLVRQPGAKTAMAAAVKARSARRRRTALAAQIRRGGEGFAAALRTAIADRDPGIRRHLIRVVRRTGNAERGVLALLPGLARGGFVGRKRTAAAIGRIGHRRGITALLQAQSHAERRATCHCKKSNGKNKARRPRAYIAVVTLTPIVSDYNAELA